MAWSFRFATLNRDKMPPIMVLPQHPHLDIKTWLDLLDLPQYDESFSKFVGVEELMYFCEADIKQLGVRNSAHRARIVSSLVALRDKYERGTTNTINRRAIRRKSQRYSMSAIQENRKSETPLYEALKKPESKQKQSQSLDDLFDMEQPHENGENESNGSNTPSTPTQEALALKKALEWELSLDSRDLRSHAWYYSAIPRQRAEEIVQKDGDFLVRDCVSQPGNYVLTCKSKGTVLHFVINKITIHRETVYERVQYQFEDDSYDTVPDLITFYVGSGKAISTASGAHIQFPCNRRYPLSYYAAKYGTQINQQMANSRGVSPLNSPSLTSVGFRYTPYNHQTGNYNSYRSPMSSPPRTKRDTPPRLPSKKQRSQSLTPIQPGQMMVSNSISRLSQEKYSSADGVIQGNDGFTKHSNGTSSADIKRNLTMEKCNSADGVIQTTSGVTDQQIAIKPAIMARLNGAQIANSKLHTQSLPRINLGNGTKGNSRCLSFSRGTSLTRDGGIDRICNRNNRKDFEEEEETTPTDSPISPPPKPTKSMVNLRHNDSNMTLKDLALDNGPLNRVASYHASGSDSGNGSGDSAQSSAANDSSIDCVVQQQRVGGVVIRNPRFMSNSASSVTLKSFADTDYQAVEENLITLEVPTIEQVSIYDLENFHTLLLPSIENKPLDNGALNTFRMMLSETAPRILANHMTRIDIRTILGEVEKAKKEKNETSDNILDCKGLELIALEHGKQFRMDLIERTECIRLLVAVTILTCTDNDERTETLNKWIQVAVDTKTALGNLFGFSSIMLGLCMPQIEKLETTWHTLRQKYTDSAFNFEAKLRPTLKNMNNCTNPQAPNTTVPHLLPYLLLRDRSIDEMLDSNQSTSSLIHTCINPWETNSVDFGLTTIMAHLDSVRGFAKNLSMYERNAQIVLSDSRIDDLLEDSFRTEFHIKFLWGSKGALASAEDRHTKLEQILSLMVDKFCGVKNGTGTVTANEAG